MVECVMPKARSTSTFITLNASSLRRPTPRSLHPRLPLCSRPRLIASFGGRPTLVLSIHQLCHQPAGAIASSKVSDILPCDQLPLRQGPRSMDLAVQKSTLRAGNVCKWILVGQFTNLRHVGNTQFAECIHHNAQPMRISVEFITFLFPFWCS